MHRFGTSCITKSECMNNVVYVSIRAHLVILAINPLYPLLFATATAARTLGEGTEEIMNLVSGSPLCPFPTNKEKPNDRLSEVPDHVLSFILSLLSIRDAAKARILSRRWRYIYPSILHLDFDFHTVLGINYNAYGDSDILQDDMRKFVKGVDQFLELYNGQKVDSFRVFFAPGDEYASHIDQWIRSAIRMKTKRLDLDLSANRQSNNFYDFPCQLLPHVETSQLKHMCLKSCNLRLSPHLVGRLISLNKLDLELVPLDQNSAKSILSGCLNLEWLRLRHSTLPETFCIHGPSLRLKTLIVQHCDGVNKIEISSVGLTTFEYFGKVKEFTFIDVGYLERVHLSFHLPFENGTKYMFNGLANDLPQLQILSLDLWTFEVLPVPASINRFCYLKQLELFVSFSFDEDLLFLAPILDACPILQKFHLMFLSRFLPNGPGRELPTRSSREQQYSKLVHFQLTEIEVHGFNGAPNEVGIIIYLLNNVVSLERMILNPGRRSYLGGGHWRSTRRLNLPWIVEENEAAYDLLRKENFSSPAKLILL